jgi:cation diffusion facilitator family transporter
MLSLSTKKEIYMTELLLKIFIKDYKNVQDSKIRMKYGSLGSIFGIITNFAMFVAKIIIGLFTGSISIIADAINNLGDLGTSSITLFGYKLSSKPADKDHPYGHHRMEYIISLIIAVIILALGINIVIQGISSILYPSDLYVTFPWVTVIILSVAILIKLMQSLLYNSLGKRINSMPLKAVAMDSRNDVISTIFVIGGIIISYFTGFTQIDGIFAIVVASLIIYSGIDILIQAADILIGEAPEKEIVKQFIALLESAPEVLGVHDIQMHCYGPNATFSSAHVEVDGSKDIFLLHDAVDNLESRCLSILKINTVLHMDPIKVNDPETDRCKKIIRESLEEINPQLTFHDFRIVSGPSHINTVFDIVVPFEETRTKKEILSTLNSIVKSKDPRIIPVVTCDDEYTCLMSESDK